MGSGSTRKVAAHWFDALSNGRFDEAADLLAPDVEWINYSVVPGYNDAMPWIGTYVGRGAVMESLKTFLGVADVQRESLDKLIVDGEDAIGIVCERSVVRATGQAFEIEFIQHLTIRDGKIVRWKSYTDPSPILRAIKGAA
ncbi:MAG: nuclear transport factor 2 family protein [Chloroflexota bacterium]